MSDEGKYWYAAVTYRKERIIKERLDRMQIENFVPMREVVKEKDGRKIKTKALVIPGYVFIHTDPQTNKILSTEPSMGIRYLKQPQTDIPATIPPCQMRSFMLIVNLSETARLITHNLRRGDRVRVVKGPFAGIEGELIRISGHKRVVVRLNESLAVATTYIPGAFLERI